jgi:thiol-disulfide isomerase/thioredoxin
MGRLSPVILLALFATAHCDNPASSTTAPRSDQVIASGVTSTVVPPPASAPVHVAAAPARAHKLCESDGDTKGRALPRTPASHAEAAGEPPLDGELPKAGGDWLWINFWAAWCAPCKEEMPRLMGWRDRLTKAGVPIRLVFVSLDDDERQLDTFLEAQSAVGVRSTLWLPEGPARTSWLKSLHMKPGPELPEQVVVDPTRRVRCFIEGAVEDADYAEIAALTAQ